jgi:hypothetical protein
LQIFSFAATIRLHLDLESFDLLKSPGHSQLSRDIANRRQFFTLPLSMKGATMENRSKSKVQWRWVLSILVIGAALALFACEQQGGQTGAQPGGLANKPPPSLGAIANVDGSDETKKDEKKPEAGAEQKPAESPAGGQPAQAAPKQ